MNGSKPNANTGLPSSPQIAARHPPLSKLVEVIQSGYATPAQLNGRNVSGCLYRKDGSKVVLSERFSGYSGDLFDTANPETINTPKSARRIEGRGVYLGHLMSGHYGHFLLETLSTFWIFETNNASDFDYFLFHPFVFSTQARDYTETAFRCIGIESQKVIVIGNEPLLLDHVSVPQRLLRLNHSVHSDVKWVYDAIAHKCTPVAMDAPNLYLSRRRFNASQHYRVLANEILVEAVFARSGFKIIYPETISFSEQVSLFANATVIAGPSGSALHNCVFMKEGSKVIEIGDPRYGGRPAPTQELCAKISRVENHFIPFHGWVFGSRMTMLIHISYLSKRLSEFFRERGEWSAAEYRSGFNWIEYGLFNPRGLLEVGFRSIRPSIGYFFRLISKRWCKRIIQSD